MAFSGAMENLIRQVKKNLPDEYNFVYI